MAPRGRPRDTPEKRALRRLQREARRQKLQQIAQHLRDVEALNKNELALETGATRRSLRIVSKKWNKNEPGQYTFILFGEEGWDENDECTTTKSGSISTTPPQADGCIGGYISGKRGNKSNGS